MALSFDEEWPVPLVWSSSLAPPVLDAETAERWGYLNRVFPSKEALSAHVDALAQRIASFPTVAVTAAKRCVLNSLAMSQDDALNEEFLLFASTLKDPA